MRSTKQLSLVAAAALTTLTLVGCSGSQEAETIATVEASGPSYSTVEDLSRASVLVVRGTVGKVVGTNEYRDINDKVWLVEQAHTVLVDEVIAGTAVKVGAEITVITPDGLNNIDTSSGLSERQSVVLFLAKSANKGKSGFVGDWVIVGEDNGVFDVEGSDASPRKADPQDQLTKVSVQALREKVVAAGR